MVLTAGPHPRKESLGLRHSEAQEVWGRHFLTVGSTLGHLVLLLKWVKDLMECAPPHALLSPHFCPLSMPSYFSASFILSDQDRGQPGCPSAQILLGAADSPSQQVLFSYRGSSPWRHQPSPLSLSDSPAWRKITPLAMMVNSMCQLS